MVESGVLLLSMIGMLIAILCTQLPMRDSLLIFLWILALMSSFCLLTHSHRAVSQATESQKKLDAQLDTLTKTLMAAESGLADKDRILADNSASISHLSESYGLAKQQISILRNEVAACKTKLEEERQLLGELRHRAEMSDKLKASLMANINDELRNPLNTILGYTSLLRNSSVSDSRKAEYIDIINRDSRRFLNTVNALFFYSRIMVGDIKPVVTTFNINALLHNSVSIARQQVAESGKNIDIRLQECVGSGFIGGYEAGYVRILSNLLSNAVKFTHEGHVDVQCVVDGPMVRISVSDTGIGFGARQRETIFDAFQQADHSLTRKYQGTGLGLAICRALSRIMGGNIQADSHEGVGSRFVVEIPLSTPSDTDIDVFARVQKILDSGKSKGRILVITPFSDDFDFINRFAAQYDIEVVRSSSEADSAALIHEYSDIRLAIIDLYSWALEGVESAEQIFRLRPGIRFAFISNGTLEPLQIETLRTYSDIILSKPLTSLALTQVLSRW